MIYNHENKLIVILVVWEGFKGKLKKAKTNINNK